MMSNRRGGLTNSSIHPVDPNNPGKPSTKRNTAPPGFSSFEEFAASRAKAIKEEREGKKEPQQDHSTPTPPMEIAPRELPKDDVFSSEFLDPESRDLPVIDLNTPTPSKGVSYPKGFKIAYRPYVFGEVKKVSGSKTSFEELARTILAGIKTSFPIGDLTFYDFLYLALLRKLSTIGDSTIIATHICPNKKCQVSNSYEVQVGPKNCEIDFWDVTYNELPIEADLKLGDDVEATYQFYPLTIRQYLELEMANLHKDPVARLAAQCRNVPFDTARTKMYRTYGEESHVLTQIEELLFHGVKPINVACPSCGAINLLQLDGGGIVIRPFRSPETVANDRIRFGKTPKHKPDSSV